MEGTEAMKLARARLSAFAPYLSSALWTLRFRPTDMSNAPGNFAVDDRWNLYFDPDEAVKLFNKDIGHLVFVLWHEVSHLLRRHGKRNPDPKQHMRWNIAADCEINDSYSDICKPTDNMVTPFHLGLPNALSAEEYYDKLRDKVKKVKVNCGSGAHGVSQPWEDGVSGASKFESEAAIRATAKAVTENKDRGNIPAGLARWAETEVSPVVDWRRELGTILRNAVTSTRGHQDYTYAFPSRRQSVFGQIIMPSMIEPNPNPALVFDTSGSMSERELGVAAAEAEGLFRILGFRQLRYLAVDTEVAVDTQARSARQIKLKGGGGTDMRVGIVKALEYNPSCIVVFTDGYSPWDMPPPGRPVIIILINGNDSQEFPSWAKVISVKGARN